MSHDRRNSSLEASATRRSASLRSSTRYWAQPGQSGVVLAGQLGQVGEGGPRISGPAVWRPGAKWPASPRLAGRSSRKRTFSGRSWASSMMRATRGPFGVQSITGEHELVPQPGRLELGPHRAVVVLRADGVDDAPPVEGADEVGPGRVDGAPGPRSGCPPRRCRRGPTTTSLTGADRAAPSGPDTPGRPTTPCPYLPPDEYPTGPPAPLNGSGGRAGGRGPG